MRRQIKLATRRELTTAIGQWYQAADRNSKKTILDEFTKVTGYHRKHAIRVLNTQPTIRRARPAVRRIGGRSVPAIWRWTWWCIAERGRRAALCIRQCLLE